MGILNSLGLGRSRPDSLAKIDLTLTITTVVGAGDGGQAIDASLERPNGVAVDEQGNVFIADADDSCVRMVDGNGIISTVFGTSVQMASADGGRATEAGLSQPQAVVVDRWANLFIADSLNHRIYKVDKKGVTSPVAGRGRYGFEGDGKPATRAKLHKPRSVAVDGEGNIFIADTYNNRVRKIDRDGNINTVAGSGVAGFGGDGGPATEASLYWPSGLAVDNEGNLYISDRGNNRIRKVDRNGIIATSVGTGQFELRGDGGPATEAALRWPLGIAVDPQGNLFFADSFNRRVRMVDTKGVISTVAGAKGGVMGDGGPAVATSLVMPWDVATNAQGELFIADARDYRIRKVDGRGIICTIAGTGRPRYGGDQGPALQATLCCPHDVAVDRQGNLFIADSWNESIRKVDRDGIITTLIRGKRRSNLIIGGAALPEKGKLEVKGETKNDVDLFPMSLAVDPIGNVLLADKRNNRICRIDNNGVIGTIVGKEVPGFEGDGGPAIDALLWWPHAVAIDDIGNIFIADSANNRVRKVEPSGIIDTVAGNGLAGFIGDRGPALEASLNNPCGLAIDSKGNVLIADSWNNRIRRVDPMGIITTVAGTGQPGSSGDGGQAKKARLYHPYGIAVAEDGSIWIAERGAHRLRKVRPDGIIVSIAGQAIPGYEGDAGPAGGAKLNRPCGLAMDEAGNLYIADSWNHRIRRIAC